MMQLFVKESGTHRLQKEDFWVCISIAWIAQVLKLVTSRLIFYFTCLLLKKLLSLVDTLFWKSNFCPIYVQFLSNFDAKSFVKFAYTIKLNDLAIFLEVEFLDKIWKFRIVCKGWGWPSSVRNSSQFHFYKTLGDMFSHIFRSSSDVLR